MADLTGTYTYQNTVRAFEESDLALPALWDQVHQTLLNNDAFLKAYTPSLLLTNLRALNGTTAPTTITTLGHSSIGDGGEGVWTKDLSVTTAQDDNGSIVAFTDNSGGYRRIYNGETRPEHFGWFTAAWSAGNATAGSLALKRMLNAWSNLKGLRIRFGVGTYNMDAQAYITRPHLIYGMGEESTTFVLNNAPTGNFDNVVYGAAFFIVHHSHASHANKAILPAGTVVAAGSYGYGAQFKDFKVLFSGTKPAAVHGLMITTITRYEHISVQGASGDGFFIIGGSQNNPLGSYSFVPGNTNTSVLEGCAARSCGGWGFHTAGGDANQLRLSSLVTSGCTLGGIYDDSQYGNTWDTTDNEANIGVDIKTAVSCNTGALFIKCYCEGKVTSNNYELGEKAWVLLPAGARTGLEGGTVGAGSTGTMIASGIYPKPGLPSLVQSSGRGLGFSTYPFMTTPNPPAQIQFIGMGYWLVDFNFIFTPDDNVTAGQSLAVMLVTAPSGFKIVSHGAMYANYLAGTSPLMRAGWFNGNYIKLECTGTNLQELYVYGSLILAPI